MEPAIETRSHSARDVDFDDGRPFGVGARRQPQVGVGAREGVSAEPPRLEGAVEPPETGICVESVHDPQPFGGLGGPVEGREGDAFGGVEHRNSEGRGRLPDTRADVTDSLTIPDRYTNETPAARPAARRPSSKRRSGTTP